jgi:hypothetical protein
MILDILSAAGVPYRAARFLSPPSGTYAVYFDDVDSDGLSQNLVQTHDVTIELYESAPDVRTEAAIEAALDTAGVSWTKQDRYWLQEEQLFQVVYSFNYVEK